MVKPLKTAFWLAVRRAVAVGALLLPLSVSGNDPWTNSLNPITAGDWNAARAAHLLERAGFGGTPEEVAALAKLTPAAAVAYLVRFEGAPDGKLPAFDHSGVHDSGLEPFPPSRPATTKLARQRGEALGVKIKPSGNRRLQPVVNRFFYWLRASYLETQRVAYWWADRMLVSPRPLQEKMALFWHGHFAVNESKVRDYRKMLGILETFHRHGLGDFRELVVAVAQSPAMLSFLDAGVNVKGSPQRKFRPRNHGALHHGCWPLHRDRYSGGRAGVYRLELRRSPVCREQRTT